MKPAHDQLLDIARELHQAAAENAQHAKVLVAEATRLDAQATQLRVRADEALAAAVEDGPDDRGGWTFDGVRDAARHVGQFTVEAFTATLGTRPIQTIGWIRQLVDEGIVTTAEDDDGLRVYVYVEPPDGDDDQDDEPDDPADDDDHPVDVAPVANGNGNGRAKPFPVERGAPVPGTGKQRHADANVARLIRQMSAVGCTVKRGRSGHYRIYHDGRMVGSMASTPTMERDLKNTVAQLKRNGVPL